MSQPALFPRFDRRRGHPGKESVHRRMAQPRPTRYPSRHVEDIQNTWFSDQRVVKPALPGEFVWVALEPIGKQRSLQDIDHCPIQLPIELVRGAILEIHPPLDDCRRRGGRAGNKALDHPGGEAGRHATTLIAPLVSFGGEQACAEWQSHHQLLQSLAAVVGGVFDKDAVNCRRIADDSNRTQYCLGENNRLFEMSFGQSCDRAVPQHSGKFQGPGSFRHRLWCRRAETPLPARR